MSGCASLIQRSSTGSRPFTPLTLYVAIFIGLAVTLGTDDHPFLNIIGRAPVPASYPIRKVITPVPVEGGVAGGALPKSAGSSFHGRREPNGSACQRRTMAGVQEEAKHAISAMSPLKSCDVEKPKPQRWIDHCLCVAETASMR